MVGHALGIRWAFVGRGGDEPQPWENVCALITTRLLSPLLALHGHHGGPCERQSPVE